MGGATEYLTSACPTDTGSASPVANKMSKRKNYISNKGSDKKAKKEETTNWLVKTWLGHFFRIFTAPVI